MNLNSAQGWVGKFIKGGANAINQHIQHQKYIRKRNFNISHCSESVCKEIGYNKLNMPR